MYHEGIRALALFIVVLAFSPYARGADPDAGKAIENADVVFPSHAHGGVIQSFKFRDIAKDAIAGRLPVVIFLHGSSGQSEVTRAFQKWLASDLGVASFAPDSMAIPGRITYKSPASKDIYEHVHALRNAEIGAAVDALRRLPWVDNSKLFLAGTSEGAVAVARWKGSEFAARMIFAWSCESNYFVDLPRNGFTADEQVLNVISANDPYFSSANPWNSVYSTRGHCADALKGNPNAQVALIPDAPHTLFNLRPVHTLTAGFIKPLLAK